MFLQIWRWVSVNWDATPMDFTAPLVLPIQLKNQNWNWSGFLASVSHWSFKCVTRLISNEKRYSTLMDIYVWNSIFFLEPVRGMLDWWKYGIGWYQNANRLLQLLSMRCPCHWSIAELCSSPTYWCTKAKKMWNRAKHFAFSGKTVIFLLCLIVSWEFPTGICAWLVELV